MKKPESKCWPAKTGDEKRLTLYQWDWRFMNLARHIAGWSKDPSTQCGAVITRPDKTIAAVGYNGFPRGIRDDTRLGNRKAKYIAVVHAEMNAILNAHERDLSGMSLYVWPIAPCESCAKHIVQTGISSVIIMPDIPARWDASITAGLALFSESGVEVRVMTKAVG